ncbi:MAG: ABC transporter substrate-binding protein [Polyangiales bacterium]
MTNTNTPTPAPRNVARRRLLLGASALGAVALAYPVLARRASTPTGPQPLRIGRTGKGGYDVVMRAAHIDAVDVVPQYSDFQSGHLQVEALNGGSLDYGGMSEIPPVFAAASSIQSFRQIAVVHADVNNQVVLVPKGSKAASIADLKGKKVGYVRATTSQYFLLGMLREVGLGWKDIEPVALNVSDGAAAFSQGALDGWAIYGFPIQRAIAHEGARVLKTALGILSGNYLVSAHVDALADPAKRAAIGRYLEANARAFAWQAAHWEEWAQVLAKEIDVPLPFVQDQIRARSAPTSLRVVDDAAIRSQQAVADVFFEAGLIPTRVDVRPLWDDRFNDIIRGTTA